MEFLGKQEKLAQVVLQITVAPSLNNGKKTEILFMIRLSSLVF